MNILYLEDDIVDQIAFKRLIKKFDDIQYCISNTVEEAITQLRENTFDLVLSDFYVGGETIFDLMPHINHTPTIMLSGLEDERQTQQLYALGLENHFPKPLTVENLNLIFNRKVQFADTYTYHQKTNIDTALQFDFSYLNSISNGNEEVKMEMIKLFLEVASSEIQQIGNLFQKRAWKDLGFLTHKLKSNFRVMGLFELLNLANEIERDCKNGGKTKNLEKIVPTFTSTLMQAVSLAEREIQKLGN